jgi:TetR/AcrR family transcriptional regulator, transcriptional repressor of aconitase
MATRDSPQNRSQSAIAAAAQALNDATAALSEALKSASSNAAASAAESVETDVAKGIRTAARTVENVAAKFSTRTVRRDQTRTDLIAAAMAVFAEKGYEGTSVDDVAAAAGYTKGAIYSHFGSKAGIFLAIFTELGAPGEDADALRVTFHGFDTRTALDRGLETALHSEEELAVNPCVTLTHELILFGLRNPGHRQEAAQLISQTIEASANRVLAAREPLGVDLSADPTNAKAGRISAEERRSVLDELLVSTAVSHTITMLRAVGVAEVSESDALRILRVHRPH